MDSAIPIKQEVICEDEDDTRNSDNEKAGESDLKLFCTPDIHVDSASIESPISLQNVNENIDMRSRLLGFGLAKTSKRRHNVLSLEAKLELIKKLEDGETVTSLSRQYNVGRATIFDIKNKKDSIISFATKLGNEAELKTRKTVRNKLSSRRLAMRSPADASNTNNAVSETSCVSEAFPSPVSSDTSENSHAQSTASKGSSQAAGTSKISDDGKPSSSNPNTALCVFEATPSKRKHHVLSIETKIEIIQRLERGESGAVLAPLYNIGRATISDIKSKKDSILMFASKLKSEDGLKKRKTMRKANDTSLEDAVYMWYIQKLSQGEVVTGPLLCEKAKELNSKLRGPSDFKASTGWLKNFRSRHGIKQIQNEMDTFAVDSADANSFLQSYLDLLQQEGYSRDDIYVADETSVDWQTMPENSLVYQRLAAEMTPERVTVLVCSNSSWNHALPLLMIGKVKWKKCFGKISCLPLIYKWQRSGWMDSEIFMEWYAKEFVPNVKRERELAGKFGKVLLLLDSATFHPAADMLNIVDENFKVMFLPPNVTALAHPMDQSVIKRLKWNFKKQVLRRLLLATDDEDSLVNFQRKLSLKECCYMLADAWGTLAEQHMRDTWKKQWGHPNEREDPAASRGDENDLKEFAELFKALPGFSRCTLENAREWLKIDAFDPGEQMLDEDEIVTSVKAGEDSDVPSDEDGEDEESQESSSFRYPSHPEAFNALDTAMEWCERQGECSPDQLLLLKRLRDLAARKIWISTDEK